MDNCYLDALAVIRLFKMSEKKHLIITGSRGSGKSYLLNNILKHISRSSNSSDSDDMTYTSEPAYMSDFFNFNINYLQIRRTDKPEVVIKSNLIENNKEFVIGIPPANPCSHVSDTKSSSHHLSGCKSNGNNMIIVQDGFINCAIPAIQKHLLTYNDSFFIIDELGYLESSCVPFQESIKKLLDNSRVIAVIRKQSTEFLNGIRNRNDILLVDIDNPFDSISCIIMASGMSLRFGSNKLLASFNNHTLFENAISLSRFADFGETLAVTRHDSVVRICKREHIHCIKHDMPYRNDMVRLGVSHILKNAPVKENTSESTFEITFENTFENTYISGNSSQEECLTSRHMPQGILFLPSDQPLISHTSLQLLCLAFIYYNSKTFSCHDKNGRICRLAFNDVPGSPVIFPACYYDDLLNLPQGKGGGFIAKKHPEQVILIPAQDEYELYDIDTPDDLNQLSQYLH